MNESRIMSAAMSQPLRQRCHHRSSFSIVDATSMVVVVVVVGSEEAANNQPPLIRSIRERLKWEIRPSRCCWLYSYQRGLDASLSLINETGRRGGGRSLGATSCGLLELQEAEEEPCRR